MDAVLLLSISNLKKIILDFESWSLGVYYLLSLLGWETLYLLLLMLSYYRIKKIFIIDKDILDLFTNIVVMI